MPQWLDLLPDKVALLNRDSFDTPRRSGIPNQGGSPPGVMRVPPRELRRLLSTQGLTFTRDADRFVNAVPVPFVLVTPGAPGAFLVVNAAELSKPRALLVIRNATTSAGSVFIGLGGPADINNAFIALAAGQTLVLDTGIPQNDIYCATDTATAIAPTFGVVTYGISRYSG